MGKFTGFDGGEARYCSDDDQNIDIDVALSYIVRVFIFLNFFLIFV